MSGQSRFVALAIVCGCFCCLPLSPAQAQSVPGSHARQLVTQTIDDSKLVPLHGNTRGEATAENDRGPVADDFLLEHMLLQLRRPAEQELELQQFIEDLHNENSPTYHRWISALEFGERFGPSEQDIEKITAWLESQHLKVNVVYPSGMLIDFSGTVAQVQRAFHTEIHHLEVNGEKHVSNMSDPQIPAALASVVVGIVSLHDFLPHALHEMRQTRREFTFPDPYGGTAYAVVPADLATIYNLNPLFNSGNSGQGQTIALIEDTDVYSMGDWVTFRETFGLSTYTAATITAVHPLPPSGTNNCLDPGVVPPNDAEAILDGEWASAAAPSAAIQMVSCQDSGTTFGGLIAVQNLLNAKSGPPPIMSISYGQCEAVNGAAANTAYNSTYQQGVAEGVSIFVAAGDSGAAGCNNSGSSATYGIAANAFASTPYNVAVGGTDFSDSYSGTNSTYWSSTNSPAYGSALSYVPEIPWNDSCAGALVSKFEGFTTTYGSTSFCNDSSIGSELQTVVAGGGAPSGCATGTPSISGVVSGTCKGWPKPSWQSVLGNPADGVRDTPDVALFAADGLWGHYYVFCWSDTVNGGSACTGNPSSWSGAGGTSFASPIMAGIQALVNQRAGTPQGNPNSVYYELAATEYGSGGNNSCNSSSAPGAGNACVFYDVTLGDMDVNCTGTYNCYLPSGAQGVLSTSDSSFAPAYGTTTGWDFATGIGSVNATNLVNNWPGVTPVSGFSLAASPSSLTLLQGASGTSTITISMIGNFSGIVSLSASGLPSGVSAAFAPSATSTSSTLTLTASSTATTGTVILTVSGTSGSLTNATLISLTVNAPPNFALSASPTSLSFQQAASATSTITVTPEYGFTGSVSLSASGMPSGVSASFSPASTTGTSVLTLAATSTAPTGSFNVTITGTSGSLSHTVTIAVTVTLELFPLPSPWVDQDIGPVGPAGSAGYYLNGTYIVNASGQYIWYTQDGMNFAYQPLSGDGTIVAQLLSLQGGYSSESSGVMIRDTLDPSSPHMYAAFSQSAIWMAYRATQAGSTTGQSVSGSLPYWVKVSRSGNSFSSFGSPDGVNWTQIGTTQTINMAQNVYVGLAVSSDSNSLLATATFANISISATAPAVPNISSISPTSGPVGTQVVISGSNFGASQGNSVVTLNGAAVTVNSWSASSITVTIPSGATSGSMVVSVAPSMTNSNAVPFTVTAPALPNPWVDQDVGTVGPAGSASFSNGTFTINASGQWIWYTSDGMNFAYQPLSGDGTIVARLLSLQGGYSSESSGVMIRETLQPGSTHMYAAFSQGAIWDAYRASTGGSTTGQSITAALPYWVEVVRSGNNFSGYGSPDGVNWTQIGTTQTIPMAQNVYIGLAVSSDSNSQLATATFSDVSVSSAAAPAPSITGISPVSGPVGTQVVISGSGFGTSQGGSDVNLNGAPVTIDSWSATSITVTIPSGATSGAMAVSVAPSMNSSNAVTFTVTPVPLPSPWVDQDVGTVGPAGSASYSNGTFTVNASGQWIWYTSDGMNFVYQPLSGDGSIVARLISLQGGYSSESSGVMIRETLDPSSTHMYAAFSQSAIWDAYRASTGGSTTGQSIPATLPYWVKVVRSGNNFSGYGSPDGVNWTQIGTTQTISMAQNVYIGLAVSSDSNSMLATATIDNVTVQ